MLSTSRNFEAAARAALANDNLQRALGLACGAPKEWRVALRGWARTIRKPNHLIFPGESRCPSFLPHESVIAGKALESLCEVRGGRSMDPGFRRDSESGSCQFSIAVWIVAQPLRLRIDRSSAALTGTYNEQICQPVSPWSPADAEILADPPLRSCYLLIFKPRIEEYQSLAPDPFLPCARP
jgi:hypothetical protein